MPAPPEGLHWRIRRHKNTYDQYEVRVQLCRTRVWPLPPKVLKTKTWYPEDVFTIDAPGKNSERAIEYAQELLKEYNETQARSETIVLGGLKGATLGKGVTDSVEKR
jgi:hypothetical protein